MSPETFRIDEDRYSRLRLIAWWNQEKLAAAKVLVVGAGALGNEVIKNLALIGVGQIFVVDFDKIEESNLTRSVLFRKRDCGKYKSFVAAEAASEMNPDCRIVPTTFNVLTDLGLGFIREMDVIVGCLDNREARLWLNRLCWKMNRPWIDAGIQEINGIVKVFTPPGSACYECAMTETDYKLINLRYSCPLLRREDILSGKVPTAPTISSIIAGIQTQEALKIIHGLEVAAGKIMVFNGVTNSSYTTAIQRKEDCLSHETYGESLESPLQAGTATVDELFRFVEGTTGESGWVLQLDRDLVTELTCEPCGQTKRTMAPLAKVGADSGRCPTCQNLMKPHLVHAISQDGEFGNENLRAIGIPDYDIVRLGNNQREICVALAGDRSLYFQ